MFNNINKKVVILGLFIFTINIYILYNKLTNDNYKFFTVSSRADLLDGSFGFVILFILFLLSLSIISFGLNLNNKFSKVGKYLVYIFSKMIGK